MRNENRTDEGECFQVNDRVRATFSTAEDKLEDLRINNSPVQDGKIYTLTLINYIYINSHKYLGHTQEELMASGGKRIVSTSALDTLTELLKAGDIGVRKTGNRLVFHS
jgi:hypothetical protein